MTEGTAPNATGSTRERLKAAISARRNDERSAQLWSRYTDDVIEHEDRHAWERVVNDDGGDCRDAERERQAFLQQSTNCGVDAGIRNRQLVPYLCGELPVLATAVKINRTPESQETK